MSDWRITAWSRELGRGVVSCAAFGTMPFDDHHTDVDDFDVGEEVLVEFVREGALLSARRVRPVRPHLLREEPRRSAPVLDASVAAEARAVLAEAEGWIDFRVSRLDASSLEIEVDNDHFSYPPFARLIVEGLQYVELPIDVQVDSVSLSKETERAYLHSRAELDERAIAVTLIDDNVPPRFFFVVGRCVRFERAR